MTAPATSRFTGKVALVTGAARGQGREIARRLAAEGADIIALDIAAQIDSVPYPMASAEDLAETAREIEALGRRVVAAECDIRDYTALSSTLDRAVDELSRLDIVAVNAGVFSAGPLDEITDEQWDDVISVNLTGAWHTIKAVVPHLRAVGGGSIVVTSSTGGVMPLGNCVHYVASKHGLVGIMRAAALEYGADRIRVNSIHPTLVNTPMVNNPAVYALFTPDIEEAGRTSAALQARFQEGHLLPVPWVEPEDIANVVLWLASDESRYVTGEEIRIDAGQVWK